MIRRIDHCVLPVADLGVAGARFEALGFTVAPVARHPFGTGNACVFLADDSYLEPLAIVDRVGSDAAVAEGNVFVARDRAFRRRFGDEGFSALVFKTDDADADQTRFVASGMSGGPMLTFSRPYVDEAGERTLTFRLAFAGQDAEVGGFLFTCERVGPTPDRSHLTRHANGALGIVAVAGSAGPAAAQMVATAIGAGREGEGRQVWEFDGARLELEAAPGGLAFTAIRFAVEDIAATEDLFKRAGIAYVAAEGMLVVPPAPGQGATLQFEAK